MRFNNQSMREHQGSVSLRNNPVLNLPWHGRTYLLNGETARRSRIDMVVETMIGTRRESYA